MTPQIRIPEISQTVPASPAADGSPALADIARRMEDAAAEYQKAADSDVGARLGATIVAKNASGILKRFAAEVRQCQESI